MTSRESRSRLLRLNLSGALSPAPLRALAPVRPIRRNMILAPFAGHFRFDLSRHLLRLLHHIIEPCQQGSEFFWCQFRHVGGAT